MAHDSLSRAEEGVNPIPGGGGAHASQGREDKGKEEATEVDATSEMLAGLLSVAGKEEAGGVGNGGGEVGFGEGAGNSGIDG